MRHSRADCVTNGVGHVMEFLSMDADRSVSSIQLSNMLNQTLLPSEDISLHFVMEYVMMNITATKIRCHVAGTKKKKGLAAHKDARENNLRLQNFSISADLQLHRYEMNP